ncbi:MAG: SPOR domain-containing protein [Candidatus Eisenbacteria bacterium]|nr:SPOR domain-containing protein [Candidatus Eisenbacteria bacterium]
MSVMEHDLHRTGPHLFGLFLIYLLTFFGAARADDEIRRRAETWIAEGRYEEARAELLLYAESVPGTDAAREARFRAAGLERDGEAYRAALEGLLAEKEDARVRLALARYRYALGAYEGAAEDFDLAANHLAEAERADALCWRGASLIASGRVDRGLDILLRVARGEGTPAERARFLAAQIQLREGEAGRAAETAAPLLEGSNDFVLPALHLRAKALLASGRVEEARAAFTEVIDRAPGSAESVEARLGLGAAEQAERAAGGNGYYIQIASFSDGENARRYLEDRRAEGVGALSLAVVQEGDKTLHKVRIGPFADEEEAERARERLAGQGLEGHVVREDGE